MSDLYVVMRESDARKPSGAVHTQPFVQLGPARAAAEAEARNRPGVRYVVLKLVDACEAAITPASWDSDGPPPEQPKSKPKQKASR